VLHGNLCNEQASLLLTNLLRLVLVRSSEFLSAFLPPPGPGSASVATPLVDRFASRVLVLFARHASLLRPLSQAGKLQLAKVRRGGRPPQRLL